MANSIIEVDTGVLKSDLSDISGEIKKLYSGAEKLEGILHQLESMWDGSAKESFSAAVNDDLRRLRELIRAVEKFTGSTEEVCREYNRCESAVSQIISSIKV